MTTSCQLPASVHASLRSAPRCAPHALSTAALVFAIATFNAHGQTTIAAHNVPTADALKRAYLNCSCEALRRTLDGEEAMTCSVIYERLKQTVFDDDFDRLLEWSRSRPLSLCAHAAHRLSRLDPG